MQRIFFNSNGKYRECLRESGSTDDEYYYYYYNWSVKVLDKRFLMRPIKFGLI